ncbi:MAG: hypothetical protein SOW20_00080 [Berryella intestinalis]|uniref:hypothetical protein n=1 Tax=Berryella intestinalis TaxID=1531429 RepID=UPI002A756F83|nr:hypothetical protein [Berryella intestinalis]MDY3128413.1 hypothetical protein [Berryella intestinalis]
MRVVKSEEKALLISPVWANVAVLLAAVPLTILTFALYAVVAGGSPNRFEFTFDPLVLVAVFALIVVHELIPLAYGIVTSTPGVTVVGMLMTLCAGGDVLIVIKLLRFRTTASDVVIYDHPTCGEALCLRDSAVADNDRKMTCGYFSAALSVT